LCTSYTTTTHEVREERRGRGGREGEGKERGGRGGEEERTTHELLELDEGAEFVREHFDLVAREVEAS